MFAEVVFQPYKAEASLGNFLVRGEIRSRGELTGYLNDRRWSYLTFYQASMQPLDTDRRIGALEQSSSSLNKQWIEFLALTSDEDASKVQVQQFYWRVQFYTRHFAIQGDLRVGGDAHDEDLFEEIRDFFPVSRASVFPIRPVAVTPISKSPLLFINRRMVQVYRVVGKSGMLPPLPE
ncbi:MAG: hypothetical protein ACRDHL_03095 [Candidatus Promineifilaceae bacterium]